MPEGMPEGTTRIEEEIREHIAGMALLDKEEVDRDTSLFSAGLIDSLNLVQLVAFVEKQYGIKVGPMDLTLDNFDSVSRISSFIRSRTT